MNKVVSCVTCSRFFHPGCVKSYFSTAADCCKRHLLNLPSLVEDAQMPVCSISSVTDDACLPLNPAPLSGVPSASSATLDTLLASVERLQRQITESEARAEARAEARFASFANDHQASIAGIVEKLLMVCALLLMPLYSSPRTVLSSSRQTVQRHQRQWASESIIWRGKMLFLDARLQI